MKRSEVSYEQMGMAALLPGMVHMLDVMQSHIDEFRLQLGELQAPRPASQRTVIAAALADAAQPKRRGRPPLAPPAKRIRPGDIPRSRTGWPLDPEERKREMARRNAVKMEKRAAAAGLHPRDKEHPRHAEWIARMSEAAKKREAALTPKKRAEHMAMMRAAYRRKKLNGHAAPEAQA